MDTMKINTDQRLSKLGRIEDDEFKVLFFVFNSIKMNSKDSNKVLIYNAVLADLCGKSSCVINRITDRLTSKGLIKKDEVKGGRKTCYYYSLPKLENQTKPSSPKKSQDSTTRKEEYRKDLEHPKWKRKRLLIVTRDNGQCQLCGSKTNLQVHHTKYYNGKRAWEYPNSTLITLCTECHEKVHQDKTHKLYPQFIEE